MFSRRLIFKSGSSEQNVFLEISYEKKTAYYIRVRSFLYNLRILKVTKVNLSLCLTKHDATTMYPVLN